MEFELLQRELNDVTKFCWFIRVSEVVVRAPNTLEMRDWESFAFDVWACSSALPATADVKFSTIGRNSLTWLGFPFLSTKDRTTSILSSFQHWYDQPTAECHWPTFGSKYWSWRRCSSSMSILPRHLSADDQRRLSRDRVMTSFDDLSKMTSEMRVEG